MASNLPKRIHTTSVMGSPKVGYWGKCTCGWRDVIRQRYAWALADGLKHVKRARGA